MSDLEYVFGTGDGVVHVWSSAADLSLAGELDAVGLDFDGDGYLDDALWDTDGDGAADVAALDLTDDGVLDHFFTDPTGLGTWNHQITGAPEAAPAEPLDWTLRAGCGPAEPGEPPAGREEPPGPVPLPFTPPRPGAEPSGGGR